MLCPSNFTTDYEAWHQDYNTEFGSKMSMSTKLSRRKGGKFRESDTGNVRFHPAAFLKGDTTYMVKSNYTDQNLTNEEDAVLRLHSIGSSSAARKSGSSRQGQGGHSSAHAAPAHHPFGSSLPRFFFPSARPRGVLIQQIQQQLQQREDAEAGGDHNPTTGAGPASARSRSRSRFLSPATSTAVGSLSVTMESSGGGKPSGGAQWRIQTVPHDYFTLQQELADRQRLKLPLLYDV